MADQKIKMVMRATTLYSHPSISGEGSRISFELSGNPNIDPPSFDDELFGAAVHSKHKYGAELSGTHFFLKTPIEPHV